MTSKHPTTRKKPNVGNSKPKGTAPVASKSPPKKTSWLGFLFKPYNLLFGFLIYVLLYFCFTKNETYNWVYNELLKSNYKSCYQLQKEIDRRVRNEPDPLLKKQIVMDTKYEAKLGADFLVLKYIRDRTPLDAIILFPPPAILTKPNSYATLRYDFCLKAFPSYFLYPRKIVYENEKDKNPLFHKAEYVLAMNGWGFQYLDYPLEPRSGIELLPIHLNTNTIKP